MTRLPEIHWDGLMQEAVGAPGLAKEELEAAAPELERAVAALGANPPGYESLLAPEPVELDRLNALADELGSECEDLVILGIGGSALGTICLRTALLHPQHHRLPAERRGGPRLHVVDNVDPSSLGGLLEVLDLRRTRFLVVTKSGGTPETLATYLICRERLERAGLEARRSMVAITDPENGLLRDLVRREGWRSLPVPPAVGGRFSVLSPVGLLPAAVVGIPPAELLAGAEAMHRACLTGPAREDPAGRLAQVSVLLDRLRDNRIVVFMPYSDRLRDLADWFRQLWAESLGKRLDRNGREVFVGQTPVKALGATDQHSQVQLYAEGPFDKWFAFLTVQDHGPDLLIPELAPDSEPLGPLQGRSLGTLLNAEAEATRMALESAGRPSLTIRIDRIDPVSLGALFYLFERTTALAGELYDIDAFDQPGVEAGKVLTRRIMEQRPKVG